MALSQSELKKKQNLTETDKYVPTRKVPADLVLYVAVAMENCTKKEQKLKKRSFKKKLTTGTSNTVNSQFRF